jgi:hypothetical protein
LNVTGGVKLHRRSNSPAAGLGSNSGTDVVRTGASELGGRSWARDGAPARFLGGRGAAERRGHGGAGGVARRSKASGARVTTAAAGARTGERGVARGV